MPSTHNKNNPAFLENVYELTKGYGLTEAMTQCVVDLNALDVALLNRIGLQTYKPGKWTVHTILQHLIDWERIWCFRAIIFVRKEGSIPEAHDQEIMSEHAHANDRTIESLVDELRIVRQSTVHLFQSFNQNDLQTTCAFFEYEMTITDIGLTIAAHQIHHFNVINERYVPLVGD